MERPTYPRSEATRADEAGRERPIPRRALWLLATATFSSSVNLRVSDPLLPLISQDLGRSVGAVSAIVAGFAVGYGLLQLLFGPIGDRFGKYLVVALASIATGLATALAAGVVSLDGLVVARFVAGGFSAAPIPLAFAWIGDVVPFERRQQVLARFLSAQFSGIVLAQALGGILGDRFGWRMVYLLVGACHVIAGLLMLAELKLEPGVQPALAARRQRVGDVIVGMVGILKHPWPRTILIAVALEAFAFYGSFAYIGADLYHRLGVGFGAVGALLAAYGFGAIAYSLTAHRLIAGLGEKRMVVGGGIVLALCYLALAALGHVAVVPVAMAGLGYGFYMFHNTLQTNATQMAPEARGLGVSLFAFALFLGQSVGVALFAPVIDRFGAPPIYVGAAVLLPLVAAWFAAGLRRRPQS